MRLRLPTSALAFLAAILVSAQAPVPFAQTVLSDFDRWDANHDGILQPKEVAKAALDPKYHGEDAAALAALHTWLSLAKDIPDLTKPWFQSYQPTRRPKADPSLDQAETRAARKAYEASRRPSADLRRRPSADSERQDRPLRSRRTVDYRH